MAQVNRSRQPHTIYLSDEEYAAVRAAAEAEGFNFNDYLRAMIDRYVPERAVPVSASLTVDLLHRPAHRLGRCD